jgi:YD repeat-containing protein
LPLADDSAPARGKRPTTSPRPSAAADSSACRRNPSRCNDKPRPQHQNPQPGYVRNQLYSVVALSDDAGSVVERYTYTAYGQLGIHAPNGGARTETQHTNRYTYTGRESLPPRVAAPPGRPGAVTAGTAASATSGRAADIPATDRATSRATTAVVGTAELRSTRRAVRWRRLVVAPGGGQIDGVGAPSQH